MDLTDNTSDTQEGNHKYGGPTIRDARELAI